MKKKIIIGSIIAVIVIGFIGINIAKNNSSSAAFGGGKATSVKAKKIEKGSISSSITASGVIEEIDKAEVFFDTPLQVKKILVQKNEKVTKGQKIIDLNMDDLVAQLEQAKINKVSQELAIKKVRTLSGTKSTGSLEAAVTMAENNEKSAESSYNELTKNYESKKELLAIGAASKAEVDSAEKSMKDAEIALKNAKLNLKTSVDNLNEAKKTNSQTTNGTNIDIEMQEQSLKGTILNISNLEAKIKRINESMLSPIDGVVSEMNVIQGAFISTMQSAYTVVNTDKLRVRADIKEFDIKTVALGQKVIITGDAINKDESVTGKVSSISSVAKKNKTASGDETLVEILISIDEANALLKPGLSVNCDIVTKNVDNALVGSFEMLVDDKDGNKLVYVIDQKNYVMKQKHVKLGITSDLNVEVVEGVSEGDLVVLNPMPNYKDGAKVKILEDDKK